ncbi:MAG: hypothetical protein QOC95_139 [Thermoleophilaceae bacterium]|jgi:hypothetical protein|nr:hypothetical protein [Thermoleophilaceae bacterium]
MGFSDSHHFRKTVAGCSMVLAPLAVLVAFIFSPPIHSDAGRQVAAFAAHQDKTLFSGLMTLAAVALAIGATLGMMHMLRERGAAYGHVGGALALVGLVATAAQAGMFLSEWATVRDGVQATDVTAWHSLTHDAAIVIPVLVIGFLTTVGFILLAAGLYRAKAVDWWMTSMIALGALGIALATPLASIAVGIVGGALLLVGLGSIGMIVLRETDADWEHTPDYHGFRPAAGMR